MSNDLIHTVEDGVYPWEWDRRMPRGLSSHGRHALFFAILRTPQNTKHDPTSIWEPCFESGHKRNWGGDRNSIFLIGSAQWPVGSQRMEGAGGLGDDSGGRMRVWFLFATERVVLFHGEGVAVEGK